MELEIRNDKYWKYVEFFILRHTIMPVLGVEVLGYFPYHTARIRPYSHGNLILPRTFFHEFEQVLILTHMVDNKVVYICKPILKVNICTTCNFALMLKDDYAIISAWDQVVAYDNKPLKLIKK